MSPASKLKSKLNENSIVRAAKEQQQKSSSTHTGPTSAESSNPGSAHNPVSGTFHSFDTEQLTSPHPPHSNNPHLLNPEETDEHSGSSRGTASEYDSQSNNGSCSGESEDHKEKAISSASVHETIPSCDNEKREKIRQKNERKHQRQRERRAQELHERCRGYLISRKLEQLSQQLVPMGFCSERAKLALMLNEGCLEQSVNWLIEGNEEEAQKIDVKDVNNLKIDISEELAQIAAMAVRYKSSKQDVERTLVACEGDLVKAEESLKNVKHEPTVTPTKADETSNSNQSLKPQDKSMPSAPFSTVSEPDSAKFLPLKTSQTQSVVERRCLNNGSSSSLSYSTTPSIQVAPLSAKMSGPLNVGVNKGRIIPHGVVREPRMLMQRPQAMNIKQTCTPNNFSASPPGTAEWYSNYLNGNGVPLLERSTVGTPLGAGSYSSKHFYPQAQSKRQNNPQSQYTQQLFPTTSSVDSVARMGSSWDPTGASSGARPIASSLGLFSGWGSTATSGGTAGHMDWNARDMMSICDYNSIDWTLEANLKPSGFSLTSPGLTSVRVKGSNGGDQYVGGGLSTEGVGSGGGPRDWTSPFAGSDIFSLPRQFVTSPLP